MSKKQIEVDNLFKPDEKGFSEWISREKIAENKSLYWGKNGAARRYIFETSVIYGKNKVNEQLQH